MYIYVQKNFFKQDLNSVIFCEIFVLVLSLCLLNVYVYMCALIYPFLGHYYETLSFEGENTSGVFGQVFVGSRNVISHVILLFS